MKKILISILVLVAVVTATKTVLAIESPFVIGPEVTAELCADTFDNDGNFATDQADPQCAAFYPVLIPENTQALCTDTKDNDGNFAADQADPQCAAFYPAATTTPTPVVTGGGAGNGNGGVSFGGGSTSGGITSGTPISATATSTATSTATTTVTTFDTTGVNLMCSNLITTYMGYKKPNTKADVVKLQAFLNTELGLKLKTDGKFGPQTLKAVKAFQTKYASSTLLPWDQAGLSKNLVANPTGYVYKTTLRQVNLLLCPSVTIPMPSLK